MWGFIIGYITDKALKQKLILGPIVLKLNIEPLNLHEIKTIILY